MAGFQFQTVAPRVLRQDILASLRKAILRGDLKPGDRLLEAEVATQMGVSRAPVREAVRQLEQEGLVEFQPHRGSTVLGVPDEEIDAIYELRAELEAKAIRRACERITDEEIEELGEHLRRMAQAVEVRDYSAVFEADLQFHGTIQRIAGYRLLRRMWESMDGMVRVRSYQAFEGDTEANEYFRRTAVSSHLPILNALKARDPRLADRAVRDHILEVSERIRGQETPPKDARASAG